MSTPAHTYDPEAQAYRDPEGRVVRGPAEASAADPLTAAQRAVAAAFGYAPAAAPDVLRVGAGAHRDEAAPSQAHRDTVAAFAVHSGARA